jgi:putative hemolysin
MEIVVILILIFLNGIFSMSEIALITARKIRLENQSNQGDQQAKEALFLARNPDRFFSTVQIGITLIGILMGIFSGDKIKQNVLHFIQRSPYLSPYADTLAVIIVVIIITYFSLVLGELVPKRIGLARPEKISKLVAAPMTFLSRLTFPFIWLLTISTRVIVKILNIKPVTSPVTEDEIKAVINEGAVSGTIEEDEQEIIERVFHLNDRNITSLMTHRTDVVWIDAHDKPEEYRGKIREALHSVYPVCDGQVDEILGVIYTRDLYLAKENSSIKSLMKKPLFIPENNSAYQVMEKFKMNKTNFGFIVDEYGSFQGMITMKDILEAIVGDMPEADEEDYEITPRKDGTFLVDAQIPFYDFLTYFEKEDWITDEEQQEFDTLAGFILHHLEHIPQVGEKVEWRGFIFEIVDMDGHRIDKILVTPEPVKEEDGSDGKQ